MKLILDMQTNVVITSAMFGKRQTCVCFADAIQQIRESSLWDGLEITAQDENGNDVKISIKGGIQYYEDTEIIIDSQD